MSDEIVPIRVVPESEPVDPYAKKQGYRSWQQTIRRMANKTVSELKIEYGYAIEHLERFGDITLRELIILKAFEEMVKNPNPSMLNLIMERDEGRVPQAIVSASGSIGDWMEAARENNIEISEVMEEAQKILSEYNKPPDVIEGEIVDG